MLAPVLVPEQLLEQLLADQLGMPPVQPWPGLWRIALWRASPPAWALEQLLVLAQQLPMAAAS